jgi:hypothetical protein
MITANQARRLPQSRPAVGTRPSHFAGSPTPVLGQPVAPVDWFRRMPNGGTVYLEPGLLVPCRNFRVDD